MHRARSMWVVGALVALLVSAQLVACGGGGVPPAQAIPDLEFSTGQTKKEMLLRIRSRGEWKIEEIKIVGTGAAHFIAQEECKGKTLTVTAGLAAACLEYVKTFNFLVGEVATFTFKAKGIGSGASGYVMGRGSLKMVP